jgi:hypothetical protein
LTGLARRTAGGRRMAGNDDGPERGTQCRRGARVKGGVASTGAWPRAPRDPKDDRRWECGPGGRKREELDSTSLDRGRGIAKDAVLRRNERFPQRGKEKRKRSTEGDVRWFLGETSARARKERMEIGKRERNERDELAIGGQLFTKRRARKCRMKGERTD